MASATMVLVNRCAAGCKAVRDPLADLACGLLIPAGAVVDGGRAVGAGAVRAWQWAKRMVGTAALRLAERCGVVPEPVVTTRYVQTVIRERVEVTAPVPEPEPVILPMPQPMPEPMPSAAQVTSVECARKRSPRKRSAMPAHQIEELRAAIAEHGSLRAAAKALGIAESTLRSRCKVAGVELPKRGRK